MAMIVCQSCGIETDRHHLAQFCFPCIREGNTPATDRWKQVARGKVARAIARGEIPRLDGTVACVDCGKPATDYDHRDYSKPLDVAPVCRRCNCLRGPAEPRQTQAIALRPDLFGPAPADKSAKAA